MAITQTNLTTAMTASDTVMVVASGTNFPTTGAAVQTPGFLCRIDKEYFYAIQQPVAGRIIIRGRGSDGTVAQAHGTLAKVEVSSDATDFAASSPGNQISMPIYLPTFQTLGVDTTFTTAQVAAWGTQPQNFAILKATAIAITLVAPSKAQDGLEVTFTSLTDATHAITATSLLCNGGASSPFTTATAANAKAGATITLQAQNGLWNVKSSTNVTLS
jgi:hypothetical protein